MSGCDLTYCLTNCCEWKILNEGPPVVYTYIDCEDNEITITLPSGLSDSFCAINPTEPFLGNLLLQGCCNETPTPTPTQTPTPTITYECNCWSLTYITIPNDLYVRYRDCSTETIQTVLINSLTTTNNGNGTFTAHICVSNSSSYSIPVCVQSELEVSCDPFDWFQGGSCDTVNNCVVPPDSPTPTPTRTLTPTVTKTPTRTPSQTPTQTKTPSQTPTNTPTPSVTPLVCGSGVTGNNFYYYDCCGQYVVGSGSGQIVALKYNQPSFGVTKLNVPTTQVCPTPTPTATNTPTPTISSTPISTSTPLPTSTPTPTSTSCDTEIPAVRFENECKVFTLFDMGIRCNVISYPSSNTSFDGALSLIITGGTSPYNIYWEGGQRSNILSGVTVGYYPVTVVDYYGDYTASTTCQLFAPSPTPTNTSTPTPTPGVSTCNELCLISVNQTVEYGPWQFICGPIINGKQSWNYTSGDTVYNIIYQPQNMRWVVVGSDLSTPVVFIPGIMAKLSSGTVPIGPWVYAGGRFGSQLPITVTEGPCPSTIPLSYTLTTQNTTCTGTQNCNGGITFNAFGGNPPYQYSINNGLTYQNSNIFNGLCAGTYTTVVRDSDLSAFTQTVVISSDQSYLSYNIGTQNTGYNIYQPSQTQSILTGSFNVQVNPNIPFGTTINFTLVINYEIQNKGPWFIEPDLTASFTFGTTTTQVYKNNVPVTLSSSPTTETTTQRPQCDAQILTTTGTLEATLSMTVNDVISGQFACTLNMINPVSDGSCVSTITANIQVATTNVTISGCDCCGVVNLPTPATYLQELVGLP